MSMATKIAPKISQDELARRRAAAREAHASLRLEGLTMAPADQKISEAWERGEITADEMTAQILARHRRRG